ncbi:MOSC domain-containing protein [Aureimonas flava]|uniref:MOSC domain-containing protein n=1 Tax=Aureimonas flava TaxID=2320271 RepID=A0A3A1WGH9_9HYPH|nr:MOSC N-terminal beta barrel domain-containing protein [Aureimonas flava]RIX97292.1 MOSC domain-containing protein [Aureimonas flava]
MQVSTLAIHPVKGGRARHPDAADLEPMGLRDDRRWMLVDETGRFLTQREHPPLALLDAEPDEDGLHLSYPAIDGREGGERFVPVPEGETRLPVTVWGDTVDAAAADAPTQAALARWLGRPVRLVHFDGRARRTVSRDWTAEDRPVGFADGFPLLIATTASLRELNRRIVAAGGEAVPMSRFRPNIVVDGAEPFAEDGWATIGVGDVVLDLVKPCARCAVTTVDQDEGRRSGKEPLATLGRFRRSGDPRAPGVLFGWNAVARGTGILRVGDPVRVMERREGGWPLAV